MPDQRDLGRGIDRKLLERSLGGNPEESIRALLRMKFLDPDDPDLYRRRLRLVEEFSKVDPARAGSMQDRLERLRSDDELSIRFWKLAEPARKQMITILEKKKREHRGTQAPTTLVNERRSDISQRSPAPPVPAPSTTSYKQEISCGEYDDTSGVFVVEGKRLKPDVSRDFTPRELAVHGARRDMPIWPFLEQCEFRYMKKGTCCEYFVLRAKSEKMVIYRSESSSVALEVTPLRADLRAIRNLCVGQWKLGGQISAEGALIVDPWPMLERRLGALVEGTTSGQTQDTHMLRGLVPKIKVVFTTGANLDPMQDLIRLTFWVIFRVDWVWSIPVGALQARFTLAKCRFAEADIGLNPRWQFTWDRCIADLKKSILFKCEFMPHSPSPTLQIPAGRNEIPGNLIW